MSWRGARLRYVLPENLSIYYTKNCNKTILRLAKDSFCIGTVSIDIRARKFLEDQYTRWQSKRLKWDPQVFNQIIQKPTNQWFTLQTVQNVLNICSISFVQINQWTIAKNWKTSMITQGDIDSYYVFKSASYLISKNIFSSMTLT